MEPRIQISRKLSFFPSQTNQSGDSCSKKSSHFFFFIFRSDIKWQAIPLIYVLPTNNLWFLILFLKKIQHMVAIKEEYQINPQFQCSHPIEEKNKGTVSMRTHPVHLRLILFYLSLIVGDIFSLLYSWQKPRYLVLPHL